MPFPYLSYLPPTCHTRPPLVIPAPHLSFPQGFSGNPESFMLENLNGGSMNPSPGTLPQGWLSNIPFLCYSREAWPRHW